MRSPEPSDWSQQSDGSQRSRGSQQSGSSQRPRPSHGSVRLALALVAATVVVFAGVGAWSAWARSSIPMAIDAEVTSLEVRTEKHPGVDDVWLVGLDGETHHLDAAVARRLPVGARVSKDRFARAMTVDGDRVELAPSDDAGAMTWISAGTAAVALGLAGALGIRRPAR